VIAQAVHDRLNGDLAFLCREQIRRATLALVASAEASEEKIRVTPGKVSHIISLRADLIGL
jgi:hypothetical protein